MASRKYQFYRSSIINPLNDTECDYLPDGVLVVADGLIEDVLPYREACARYVEFFAHSNLHEFPNSLILPGFFDMHFHWVQDDVRLMPKASLLEWLDKYTFPAEAKFTDKKYAQNKAKTFFRRLVSVGTLGGACYGSIHDHALDYAMKEAVGDLLIGNVLMTTQSPEKLTQKPAAAIKSATRGMEKYGARYVLTPRFAIATDPATMRATAQLADVRGIFKQSHLSETPSEVEYVLKMYRDLPAFKKVMSYTEIYHKVGMLGPRSLMGHAIHLDDSEWKLLRKTKTALVHCPTSNAPLKEKGLGSGLFDFRRCEDNKVRWALGSDIGGGPFLSMLDVMSSFVRQNAKAGRPGATFVKALYRATLAGAEILGVQTRAGNLARGKEANFIVLPLPARTQGPVEEVLAKAVGMAKKREDQDHRVSATYWQGKLLFQRKLANKR